MNAKTTEVLSYDQNEWSVLALDIENTTYYRLRAGTPNDQYSMPMVSRVSLGGAVKFEGKVFGGKVGRNVFD